MTLLTTIIFATMIGRWGILSTLQSEMEQLKSRTTGTWGACVIWAFGNSFNQFSSSSMCQSNIKIASKLLDFNVSMQLSTWVVFGWKLILFVSNKFAEICRQIWTPDCSHSPHLHTRKQKDNRWQVFLCGIAQCQHWLDWVHSLFFSQDSCLPIHPSKELSWRKDALTQAPLNSHVLLKCWTLHSFELRLCGYENFFSIRHPDSVFLLSSVVIHCPASTWDGSAFEKIVCPPSFSRKTVRLQPATVQHSTNSFVLHRFRSGRSAARHGYIVPFSKMSKVGPDSVFLRFWLRLPVGSHLDRWLFKRSVTNSKATSSPSRFLRRSKKNL